MELEAGALVEDVIAQNEEDVVLTLQLLSGAEVARITVKPCETIRAVKRQIETVEGTPIKQQRLLFGQEILSNRQTLAEAGVRSDAALQLVRLGPEEPPPPTASGKVEVLDLEEWKDIDDKPTEDEIDEFAEWLGMDPDSDAHLLWIAEAGLKAPLPRHWRPCRTPDGDIFYFNFQTGKSIWDHPCDSRYRELYRMHKMKERLPQPPEEPRLRRTAPICRHRVRHTGGSPAAAGSSADRAEDVAAAASEEAPKGGQRRRLRHPELSAAPASSSAAAGSAPGEDPAWELPRRVLASSPHGLYGPQAWRQLVSAAGADFEAVDAAASASDEPARAA